MYEVLVLFLEKLDLLLGQARILRPPIIPQHDYRVEQQFWKGVKGEP